MDYHEFFFLKREELKKPACRRCLSRMNSKAKSLNVDFLFLGLTVELIVVASTA
jgi:hypothetical protein